jgi:hypothetical protein
MAKNFWQRITHGDGSESVVHVNRRGCKGRWTAKDDAAMRDLLEAVRLMERRVCTCGHTQSHHLGTGGEGKCGACQLDGKRCREFDEAST